MQQLETHLRAGSNGAPWIELRGVALRGVALLLALGLAAFASVALSGCATTQPWERETLARPAMAMDGDADREDLRHHALSTREGAASAMGGGGGGCGCN